MKIAVISLVLSLYAFAYALLVRRIIRERNKELDKRMPHRWHHMTYTENGNAKSLFIDGVLIEAPNSTLDFWLPCSEIDSKSFEKLKQDSLSKEDPLDKEPLY